MKNTESKQGSVRFIRKGGRIIPIIKKGNSDLTNQDVVRGIGIGAGLGIGAKVLNGTKTGKSLKSISKIYSLTGARRMAYDDDKGRATKNTALSAGIKYTAAEAAGSFFDYRPELLPANYSKPKAGALKRILKKSRDYNVGKKSFEIHKGRFLGHSAKELILGALNKLKKPKTFEVLAKMKALT